MIRLEQDSLVFAFPDVHPDAVLRIDFQRTLRIPDDASTYALPPGWARMPFAFGWVAAVGYLAFPRGESG